MTKHTEETESFSGGSNLDYLVRSVMRNGDRVESRYGTTREIIGGRLRVESGSLIQRPGINYNLGFMEMYQLLGGIYDPEAIQRVAPKADLSLFTPDMAYGPRIVDQISPILEALRKDQRTRQAVVFVGKPDNGPTSSLPCTITIQFFIRPGKRLADNFIHAYVNMRSWDLCRGLPYDIMMFSGLLEIVGRCLNYQAGNITVCAGSTHIYSDQMDKIPYLSNRTWQFNEQVPDVWGDCVNWFRNEIPRMEYGKVPFGIKYGERG